MESGGDEDSSKRPQNRICQDFVFATAEAAAAAAEAAPFWWLSPSLGEVEDERARHGGLHVRGRGSGCSEFLSNLSRTLVVADGDIRDANKLKVTSSVYFKARP